MADQLGIDWTLDPLEAQVLRFLRVRRGRGQAVRVPDLASLAGISPRSVQDIVHRLRVQHGAPIASAAGRPAGYYIPETPEEIEQFYHEQKSKALGTLAAAAAVKRMALPELLGQLALEVQTPTPSPQPPPPAARSAA